MRMIVEKLEEDQNMCGSGFIWPAFSTNINTKILYTDLHTFPWKNIWETEFVLR